jgi:pyrroloquinoline quinone biosynthesis protein B
VVETMALLKNLPIEQKQKLHFIHMNHTNPLLNPQSEATKKVVFTGFRIARIGNSIQL